MRYLGVSYIIQDKKEFLLPVSVKKTVVKNAKIWFQMFSFVVILYGG